VRSPARSKLSSVKRLSNPYVDIISRRNASSCFERKPPSTAEQRQRIRRTLKNGCRLEINALIASYASFWAGNIRSWVNQEPAPAISDETNLSAWRGLDSGLRLTRQWPASFFVFSQSTAVSNEDIILFLKSVLDHGNFLSGDVYGPGNHFFITMCGLLTQGAVFPEFTDAAFWRERALANLEYSLAENTLPDGAWYELAPSYHDWVVDRLNDAVLTTIRNGFGANVNEALWDKLKTMSEWMVKMGAPDRSVPTVNDSSPQSISTAGFAGWESHFTSPLIEWAELLKTETAGQNTSPDTPIRSVSLPDSGYTVLRSGWGCPFALPRWPSTTLPASSRSGRSTVIVR
jgi:hypothetical protein